jgi:hypothetical protein
VPDDQRGHRRLEHVEPGRADPAHAHGPGVGIWLDLRPRRQERQLQQRSRSRRRPTPPTPSDVSKPGEHEVVFEAAKRGGQHLDRRPLVRPCERGIGDQHAAVRAHARPLRIVSTPFGGAIDRQRDLAAVARRA